jgi:hypothetical protein
LTIGSQLGRDIKYAVLSWWVLKIGSLFDKTLKRKIVACYVLTIFESSKFKDKFADFKITSYQEGIRIILDDYKIK